MNKIRYVALGCAWLLGVLGGWWQPQDAKRDVTDPHFVTVQGPICAPTRSYMHQHCDTERRDRCWDTLTQRLNPHPTVTVGFEAAEGDEIPDNFLASLDGFVASCDDDARIEVTDCSTYPCVAAVRASKSWFENSCEAQGDWIVMPINVTCPDGSTEQMLLTTVMVESSAKAAMGLGEDEVPNGLLSGLIGQRVDTLLEMWRCAEAGS